VRVRVRVMEAKSVSENERVSKADRVSEAQSYGKRAIHLHVPIPTYPRS
jgi:hypothetical protein